VVEASLVCACPSLTVKAQAVLSRVNSLPQRFGFKKVHFLDVGCPNPPGFLHGFDVMGAGCENLLRQPHFHQVPGFASFDEAQSAFRNEAAHRRAHRPVTKTSATAEPGYRKTQSALPYQPAVPHQMGVNGAVHDV
jgi:hypothetical protein